MASREAKFYGQHACLALFETRVDDVQRAFVTEQTLPVFKEPLRALAQRRRPYRVVDDEELSRVAGTRHHEGVCVVARPLPEPDEQSLTQSLSSADAVARMLYLDGVGNPHNVGAVLRNAAHFGAVALGGPRKTLPAPSGALARVAEGAAEQVAVFRWSDPSASLRRLAEQGVTLVATAADGDESLFEAELSPRSVFLLGAERRGLSTPIRRLAHRTVAIPGTGAVESLNVASAAAVLLAEHFRRFST